MLDLKQIQCFVSVATELNFSAAARQLNMTQPPLSRHIQLLEHQLGVRLFERSTRTVKLTAAGRLFYAEAQSLLEKAHSAMLNVQRVVMGAMGNVTVSFVSTATYDFLPSAIAQCSHLCPDINITLKEMNTAKQLEALRLHQTDLAIVREPFIHPDCNCETLLQETFTLALPAQHPLAQKAGKLSPQALENQPFIMYAFSAWQPFYETLTGMFRSLEVRPRYVQYIGSTLTILSLVNAGLGLALVPESAAGIHFRNVVFRRVTLPADIRSSLYLIYRRDNDNTAFETVLKHIREAVKNANQNREENEAPAR
ncbi:LysR family transcriptional regulator [Enterobacillus tribolii]|uniref:LysR family transcriptional regulator n=1 Tax=Enterobacillus tribolii TaxID=1487935 RepID=A0A370R4L9_9GAMM|nr:LysR family transcriptional regulator [Enterobacillus tribolii]MBW7983313.1 LysR family transcriptional regulator [Enterobacillus tribolii]RDK97371.1 LysR family transcriptional regulator [Enterobacillus tribolii]